MKVYKKITFFTRTVTEAEILMAQLADEDFYAFEIKSDLLVAYIEDQFFDEAIPGKSLKNKIEFTVDTIQDQNWNEQWEKELSPVIFEDFVGIRAEFHPQLSNVRHEIVITPRMSFGTGHHATTLLMMSEMRKVVFESKTVIDFGTGTGVLAILAEKSGAKNVIAIDNDPWSIDNSRENVLKNHCNNITIVEGSNLDGIDTADVILANINRNILLRSAVDLANRTRQNGLIILSGFLVEDGATIIKAYCEAGLTLLSSQTQNGWMAMSFQKA